MKLILKSEKKSRLKINDIYLFNFLPLDDVFLALLLN
jgi:hypothetical protein